MSTAIAIGYKVMHYANMDNIAGVILAGGKSSRMGTDKAQIFYRGKPLLEHMQSLLESAGVGNIYISGQNRIDDIVPNCGPLGGIYSVLREIKEPEMIIIPVDMPLLSVELLVKLIDADYDDAAIYKEHNMPLKLRASDQLKYNLKRRLQSSKNPLSISSLLEELNVTDLSLPRKDKQNFINVNTPKELEKIA